MSEGVDAPEGQDRRLNRMVATTVVILSVAMAIGKIKDDNIVQSMQADQANKIDLWNEYQATRLKRGMQQIAAVTLKNDPEASAKAASEAARYEAESKQLKAKAQAAEDDYNVQGRRDDQFDLSDGFLSIAIALAAISALVESFWLLAGGWVASAFGLLFLVAGFEELPIHPDRLVAFLT